MARLKLLRIFAIVVLAILALEFEFGMAVNMSPNLEEISPLPASVSAIWGALRKVGAAAQTHALIGSFLVLATIAILALSLASRSRSLAIVGILCFATIGVAAYCGVAFTLSGFKNDGLSHGMATNFLLAFSSHFVLVSILSVKLRET